MNNKLFYKKNGTGIPLILIHGFTGSHESFETSVRYLRQYFKVITIDMIGHGKSFDKNPNNYTFERSVQLIKDILIELNIKKTNLLGYSLGGRLALHFAINSSILINKLILCSTSPGIKDKSKRRDRQNSDSYLVNLLKNLTKIQNKTLIFAGEKDNKYIKNSYEIQKNIKDSKVQIVPNSGHNLILENPIYIATKTKDFILKE